MAKAVTVTVETARPEVTLAEAYRCTLRKKYAIYKGQMLESLLVAGFNSLNLSLFYIPLTSGVAFDC
jgi:hypothetical protein